MRFQGAAGIERIGVSVGGTALLIVALTILMASVGTSRAFAVDEHVFDPVLSLEGGCAGSDGAIDPGCPYPPAENGGPRHFENPCGVATDRRGNIYVASAAIGLTGGGKGGRIDIFDSSGRFLVEINDENQPCSLAVDSEGNIYVAEYWTKDVVALKPDVYPPVPGVEYSPPVTIFDASGATGCDASARTVAVDPSNDHLYVARDCKIVEYASAAEGWTVIEDDIGLDEGQAYFGVDVYGQNHNVYASGIPVGIPTNEAIEKPRVFLFDGSTGEKLRECDDPRFGFLFGQAALAVDQANGDFYVDDIRINQTIFQSRPNCDPVGALVHSFLGSETDYVDIAVDDPITQGEIGYDSPNEGYVFVGSGNNNKNSNLYTFRPRIGEAPAIKGQRVTGLSETEAVLRAEVNPGTVSTTYHFEYTTQSSFETEEYENAVTVPIPDGNAGDGGGFVQVSESLTGLTPGVKYRFRLVSESEEGSTTGEGAPGAEGFDATFATYPAVPLQSGCANQQLRVGASSLLPLCRAYELVTPPSTNGRIPTMSELGARSSSFDTPLSTPNGESLIFGAEGGSISGAEGGGFHDTYDARRGSDGWHSTYTGMSGTQAAESFPGGISADHGYSLWLVEGTKGSFATGGIPANYLRHSQGAVNPACSPEPGGHFEAVGCGDLGSDPKAEGRWISPSGSHVVFESAGHLEDAAPPSGTTAVYDRAASGSASVISLLPGDIAPAAGDHAKYEGVSADGSAVAFKVNGTLYVRKDKSETIQVATGDPMFGGLSENGDRIYYLDSPGGIPAGGFPPSGDIFVFNLVTQDAIEVGSGGESVLAYVSPDGSQAYFVSPQQLDGSQGDAGGDNLYAWDGGSPRFVALLDPEDVDGEQARGVAGNRVNGLGLWVNSAVWPGKGQNFGLGSVPARGNANGSVFVFQAQANLTGYDSDGHTEIFLYNSVTDDLRCISCNPTESGAVSDAQLQVPLPAPFEPFPPFNSRALIPNLTTDGQTVFFQSGDRLVPRDVDGKVDVYEWRAQGKDGCAIESGCLALISSGESAQDDYLYAMTPDGHDVFIETSDILAPQDPDGAWSIYDARVGGGFAAPQVPGPCGGDTCQGLPTPSPALAVPVNAAQAEGKAKAKPKQKKQKKNAGKKHKKGRHKHKSKQRRGGRHRRSHGNGRAAR